jgi:hypothetical protein
MDAFACKLPSKVSIGLITPAYENSGDPIMIAIQLPSGHVARVLESSARFFYKPGQEGWEGRLASADGYRYENPSSLIRTVDDPSAPVSRDLIGSTAKPGPFSETEYSIYRFSVTTEKQFPEAFQMRLPRMVIDGKEIALPELRFQYGKWTTWKGIGGV